MAQDEGRFGRISSCRRAWAPPGVRPQAPRQVVREYSYVINAVAPALGTLTSLILPRVNTQMMQVFLQHVAQEYAAYFIVMQVDRAGWHQSKDLVLPDNIRLLPQPAYSPELNPVEHIWEELREKHFHNRVSLARCGGRDADRGPEPARPGSRTCPLHDLLSAL